ncbi:MAG: hypothetical protein WC389_17035 [Lutibacter sp.]
MPYTVSTQITAGCYHQSRFLLFRFDGELSSLTLRQAKKLYYNLAIYPSIFSETEIHPIRQDNIPDFPIDAMREIDKKQLFYFLLVDDEHYDIFNHLSGLFEFTVFGFRM